MTSLTKALLLAETTGEGQHDVIQEALVAIRNHLGMEVAYFSEFVDGRTIFRRVDAPGLEHLIKPGDSQSLDDVYCNHILEGRLPELIPDTSMVPLASGMPITSAVPIGSHVSIPVRLQDGTPFGMFCCLSPRAIPTLNERDLATMTVFANLATKQVNSGIEQRRRERDSRERIETAIALSGFEIVFQPIVDLSDMTLSGCEALCRFVSVPYRSPDTWFAEAASVGLGVDLELAVMKAVVSAASAMPEGIYLSINASPEAAASGRVPDALAQARLDGIVLEITEHAKVEDYGALHRHLAPLKARGMRVAVDDAGAGYAGLQHIVQLAPDIIKMDMSLVRSIDSDPARRALASAMIFYAREMGSCVVAEGIETAAELETLKRLGTGKGQGYFLGKPGSIAALPPLRRTAARLAS